MRWYNTLVPYKVVDYNGIQYGVCPSYTSISRYRNLRQINHEYESTTDRWKGIETPNPIKSNVTLTYYRVPPKYENRPDLIANDIYGSPSYAWVICYFNDIEDGVSIPTDTKISVPESIDDLFNKGEVLQSVSPTTLNLGEE